MMSVHDAPLGQKSEYVSTYSPNLLFPIPRAHKRSEIGIYTALPFKGHDIWNAYELSWLNIKGKPEVALGQFVISCDSLNLIESKSFKLYLNSFNNTRFESVATVKSILKRDLERAVVGAVHAEIYPLNYFNHHSLLNFEGICLDELDISCDTYRVNPHYLLSDKKVVVKETLYSDLLKSNCLVTGQPDWGSLKIQYEGPKIDREGLLKYIVSFRNHNEFHEQCVERLFLDISNRCQPTQLTVYARYTRRGGLDINPLRSTETVTVPNIRLPRQ